MRGSLGRARSRGVAVVALALLVAAVAATPALAVSSITNDMSVDSSGRYVSAGEPTYWTAKTSYGQYLLANPYTSDFEVGLNARHFNAPRTTRASGTSTYWRYVSYDSLTKGPAYRNYSGVFWVWQPRTVYNQFTATGKSSGATTGWQRSGLGQHNWSVSSGTTDYQYTYHY